MQFLLENISLLTRLLQHPVSYATLATLTPRDQVGDVDYRALGDVLTHQGFENHLQQRDLNSIPPLALPAVLLFHDGQSAVLKKIEQGKAQIEISGVGEQEVTLEDLNKQYLGYVWFVKPKVAADIRSELPEYRLSKGWFWRVIWRFRRYYYQVIVATFMINTLALVSSLYVMNVYDRVIPNKSYDTLWVLSIGVFIAISFEFIAKMIRGHLTDIAGKKADLIISSALFRRVMQIKMENKPVSAGSYANNLRDFESVREFMTSASLLALVDMPFFLLFIGVMYLVAGKLALVPLMIIPIVLLVGLLAQVPLARSINESMRESSQRQGLAVEAVDGIETLKANNAYNWVQKRWDHYTAKAAASSIKTKDISNMVMNFSTMMQQLNTVVLVLFGTYLIHAEDAPTRITMGALIACVILSGRALAPVGQIAGLAVRYQQAKVALTGVNEVAERPIEYNIDRKYIALDKPKGAVVFDDCTFAYDDSGQMAINKVSLTINAGEKVAIIGRIGSGKSTLLKMIAALYEQQKGLISFDGVDIRQIDPYYLRKQVALLGQNPRLFLGTLRDNLDMARSDGFFRDDVLLEALNRFGVAQIIQQHPKGLDMPIGEGGTGLSGGQQQIVSLARLTLKDPSVVLLDEPTSGLDQNTEQMVLSALRSWLRHRTLVVVTHRPQLLSLVDRIIVMEQGRVVMDGPKKQVLDRLAGNENAPQGSSGAQAKKTASSAPTSVAPQVKQNQNTGKP
ncbi:type I secretion system permease/ATPase [Suttonella sp. R2A3]|uniref:type I secretion system permease/ATPase n=1 Tax=Suttonella sp. R2A3 TaxID=2908648 RepID=UPI001F38E932|nr:type I secretion system permease/ATPase [Suttonella sp. R2A3]UJF25344.1 type I secretion system permease/ATPase [Suttonella sp. R2A3]